MNTEAHSLVEMREKIHYNLSLCKVRSMQLKRAKQYVTSEKYNDIRSKANNSLPKFIHYSNNYVPGSELFNTACILDSTRMKLDFISESIKQLIASSGGIAWYN